MSSNLRVNNILPSVGTNVAIGTAGGSVTLTGAVSGAELSVSGGINVTGVSTFASLNVTGNVSIAGTLTYEDVTNIDSIGIVTARNGINVSAGGINVTGVSTLGNTVVGGGTTQLIVTGDARITGILTIGTSSITLDGSNNQVNVGTGITIHHTNGVQVGGNTLHSTGLTVNSLNASGVITATSFSGSGANLTGIAVTENVRTDSLVVSGITTATGGIQVGATTSITVGDTFIKRGAVGLGQTTTTGRNAGVGTATGTIIYNSTTGGVELYDGSAWRSQITSDQFIQATGGITTTYYQGQVLYRAHKFEASGTFNVSYVSPTNSTVEYLLVAGGGAGGGMPNNQTGGCC